MFAKIELLLDKVKVVHLATNDKGMFIFLTYRRFFLSIRKFSPEKAMEKKLHNHLRENISFTRARSSKCHNNLHLNLHKLIQSYTIRFLSHEFILFT